MKIPMESYWRMQWGWVTAGEWNACNVECRQCGKELKASSLGNHLADVHDIYQQAVVAKALLEVRPPVTYTVSMALHDRALSHLYLGCEGHLRDGWMMGRHCWDVHLMDSVKVLRRASLTMANDAECRYILCTPNTGIPRNAKSEWSGNISKRRGYRRHWLSASSSWYVAICWNVWKSSNILDASLRRMM
jgi:hypothetical protein